MNKNEIYKDIIKTLDREMILDNMAVEGDSTAFGYLVDYIRNVYGVPKSDGTPIADRVLKKFHLTEDRFFRIGEIVFNDDPREEDNRDKGKILLINGEEKDGYVWEDDIVLLAMAHNDYEGENETYGDEIKKLK